MKKRVKQINVIVRSHGIGNDPTVEKSPTSYLVITADWDKPQNALVSDNKNTSTSTLASETEYDGYDFAVPSEDVIDSVVVKVECSATGAGDVLYIKVWDGTTWHEKYFHPPLTETIIELDFTSKTNWTPEKVNQIKTRMYYTMIGGCFHPESEYLKWDGRTFEMVRVRDIKVGDTMLGYDLDTMLFMPTKVTRVTKHPGKWRMVRVFLKYPKYYVNLTCTHSRLRELFDLFPDTEVLCDQVWTENHPVYTRSPKGVVPAGELEVGDCLGELYWEGRLTCGMAPIEMIDYFDFEGTVYDIRLDGNRLMFGRYLIGHLAKD